MSAHEKGIEAAGRDWLQQTGMLLINDEFESAVRAYLEASGQVLAPRESSNRMDIAGVMVLRNEPSNAAGVYEAMLAAAPQPFSQDKT